MKAFCLGILYRLVLLIGVLLVLLALLYANALQTPNFCKMTYMSPYYAEVAVDSIYSYKYNVCNLFFLQKEDLKYISFIFLFFTKLVTNILLQLLLYKEGAQRMSSFLQHPYPQGIPVLFIPGNAGHYKQGRSIASASSILCDEMKSSPTFNSPHRNPEFDFFTVDSREELSALNGEILIEQTKYVNDCIRSILSLYSHLPSQVRPQNVLLIGHSMGGIIASAVFTQNNFVHQSVHTIITLNAPHNGHPFFYRKSLADYYHNVHQYWRDHSQTSKNFSSFSLSSFYLRKCEIL